MLVILAIGALPADEVASLPGFPPGPYPFTVYSGFLNVTFTPPINGSNLQGLTRASAIKLAEELGVRVRIEPIPREALYVADELFFTGTATEVMPIRSLDHITIADGKRGPVTEHIQKRYQDIINGRAEDAYGWMSYE